MHVDDNPDVSCMPLQALDRCVILLMPGLLHCFSTFVKNNRLDNGNCLASDGVYKDGVPLLMLQELERV